MNFFLLKEYLIYFHKKTDEHSLHSPFFYHFYQNLIKDKSFQSEWKIIELKRLELLKDNSEIEIVDLGAGSKVEKSHKRQVKSIAKNSLSSAKFSQFLFRLIQNFKFKNNIELGTSLGINTAYMASANPEASVFTFEADPYSLNIAREINKDSKNINFHEGNIGKMLPKLLEEYNQQIGLVYADANHTYKASLDYFNMIQPYLNTHSIYILDDIHWSADMKKAWEELKKYKEVTTSIDLFDAGLLFFNPDFQKQDYILDF
ncbi:class I SAM-dependent methyltransferase [Marivirga sp.]|uniref:O-methyltransferase n=1 Tax=Marivirga sp. TaxID=2018662 RepID=UPI002D7F7B8E|nr:class I SAM-dependent methyltransferase [Marivirga sp.]HET8859133.1 class I SAM-dependent methyltransferase [Marivirga sp.]